MTRRGGTFFSDKKKACTKHQLLVRFVNVLTVSNETFNYARCIMKTAKIVAEAKEADEVTAHAKRADEIAAEIRLVFRRTAIDAWHIGGLFIEARALLAPKQKWGAWQTKHGFKPNSVCRYIAIRDNNKSPDELGGMGIVDALEAAGHPVRKVSYANAALRRKAAKGKSAKEKGKTRERLVKPDYQATAGAAEVINSEPLEYTDSMKRVIGSAGAEQIHTTIEELLTHVKCCHATAQWIVIQDRKAVAAVWPKSGRAASKTQLAAMRCLVEKVEELIPMG